MNAEVYDVLVTAGGAARRLGGVDKALVSVRGRTMLERVLAAAPDARARIVVGPERAGFGAGGSEAGGSEAGIRWTREHPPGSGPLAAIAAGSRLCSAQVVVVLAVDMPLLDAAVVDRLRTAVELVPDGVAVLVDAEGHRQPLAAAYRRDALTTALARIGDPRGRPARLLLDHLDVVEVPAPGYAQSGRLDIDTPADLEAVRMTEQAGPTEPTEPAGPAGPTGLAAFARRLADELGVGEELEELDLDTILDLARDAAHTVERPAAPLTTFLVGYAAARQQPPDLPAQIARARRLIEREGG